MGELKSVKKVIGKASFKRINLTEIGCENLKQIQSASADMYKNYKNMREAQTPGADDYYHCKGSYEGAKRGLSGEKTAKLIGEVRELADYPKNRYLRGLSSDEAFNDAIHDLNVNRVGRNRAQSKSYISSEEACSSYRPEKLKKKYW